AGRLECLKLDQTGVGNAGAEALASLPTLVELNLADTAVTDAVLPALAKSESLRALDLTGTNITDAGLNQFQPKHLQRLNLFACKHLSGEAIVAFHRRTSCAVTLPGEKGERKTPENSRVDWYSSHKFDDDD
ncbi:MAG: hypothetical protein ACRD3W_05680, partial [Terriglobales bacterium]